jgi:transcriptional regulator with XRE-family HTH domain
MTDAKRGLPGLLINPEAARHHLAGRSQSWLATEARTTEAQISQILTGSKGASLAVAERIAKALEVTPGHLFPQLVTFTVGVRYFDTSGAKERGLT